VSPEVKEQLSSVLGSKIVQVTPVSGGDSSMAYHIIIADDQLFCKYHTGENGLPLILAEKDGLNAIRATGAIDTPFVIYAGPCEKGAFLLMEYIECKEASDSEMAQLGSGLASLHAVSEAAFGWYTPNFIGSLPQSNTPSRDWHPYYGEQRLWPQLKMALDKKLLDKEDVPEKERLLTTLAEQLEAPRASLIHGDLWQGNYLVSKSGKPFLIDPSVSYADAGMDLAMSRLFGGFAPSFYDAYWEEAGRVPLNNAQTDLYQLYYLLVHLNLFGSSYAASVKSLLAAYF